MKLKWRALILFFVSWLLQSIDCVIREYELLSGFMGKIAFFMYTYDAWEYSIFSIVPGISLFIFFYNIQIKKSKIINLLATATFEILIFHDNHFLRHRLWNIVFRIQKYFVEPTYIFIIAVLFIAIIVFIIGFVIDLIRKRIIENNVIKTKWFKTLATTINSIVQ